MIDNQVFHDTSLSALSCQNEERIDKFFCHGSLVHQPIYHRSQATDSLLLNGLLGQPTIKQFVVSDQLD